MTAWEKGAARESPLRSELAYRARVGGVFARTEFKLKHAGSVDAVALSVTSIVVRGAVVRRISFPSIVIPAATTVTRAMSMLLNCIAVAVFFAFVGVEPHFDWVLLVPLVASRTDLARRTVLRMVQARVGGDMPTSRLFLQWARLGSSQRPSRVNRARRSPGVAARR